MLSKNIETDRLKIRDVTKADAQRVYDIWCNPDNEKYMGDPVSSVAEVESICEGLAKDEGYLKVLVLKETDELIGTCCFGLTSSGEAWGFGYSIKEAFWGRGLATEMVKAIIQFGQELGINTFVSECAEENTASARVMEKCGMKKIRSSSFTNDKCGVTYTSDIYELKLENQNN